MNLETCVLNSINSSVTMKSHNTLADPSLALVSDVGAGFFLAGGGRGRGERRDFEDVRARQGRSSPPAQRVKRSNALVEVV